MKKLRNGFLMVLFLFSINLSYSQDNLENKECIPFLIDNQYNENIYIYDSCIKDTLMIRYTVEVNFEHSLIDTMKPMIVKAVNLIDMRIYSINPSRIIDSLFVITPIETPFLQYIWDLCSTKVSYWYKHQPYEKLPQGERIKQGNTIYMTAGVYFVPCK